MGIDATVYGTCVTAEVRSIRQASNDALVLGDHVHDAFLDEVHLIADRSVSDDDVTGKKNLELQLGDDVRDEVMVGVSKERNGSDQRATIEIDDLLQRSSSSSSSGNSNSSSGPN